MDKKTPNIISQIKDKELFFLAINKTSNFFIPYN